VPLGRTFSPRIAFPSFWILLSRGRPQRSSMWRSCTRNPSKALIFLGATFSIASDVRLASKSGIRSSLAFLAPGSSTLSLSCAGARLAESSATNNRCLKISILLPRRRYHTRRLRRLTQSGRPQLIARYPRLCPSVARSQSPTAPTQFPTSESDAPFPPTMLPPAGSRIPAPGNWR